MPALARLIASDYLRLRGGALSIGGPRKRPELRPPSIPTPLQFTCRNRHFLVRKPFPCKAPEGGEEGTFMWPMTRILGWRRLPTLIRWLAASVIFGIALALRFTFGPLHEAARFLIFYPAIIIAAVLLGWKEAIFVLVLSLSAGWYFFLPPGMSLLIVGWALVGSMNIAIITALKTMTEQLAEANERQKLLFQELQHRVANTLQSAVGKLEIIKNRMRSNPTEATNMMDEAIERMSATADMHHQLHDPILFEKGLESMLREVVATVIDQSSVSLNLNVEELDLSLDQKSVIAMLVIEVATTRQSTSFSGISDRSLKYPSSHCRVTARCCGSRMTALELLTPVR